VKLIIQNSRSIFAFLLGAFAAFYFRGCFSEPQLAQKVIKIDGKKYDVIASKTDTEYIKKTETKYVSGADIYRDTTIFVEVPSVVDTAAILLNFYAKNVFTDTFSIQYGKFVIRDTVQFNKVLGRSYYADLLVPVITNTQIVKERPKVQVFAGLGTGVYNKSISEVSAHLFLKTKKNTLFGVGAGVFDNNINYKFNILLKL
jgi:hypothetical protein